VTDAMLTVENLSAWYGAARILCDLNFEVGRGEVVALMGRNGAGKSTSMKAIMGLMAQRQGTVRFNGDDISSLRPFEIARRGLGFTPEDRRIFVDLTVMENLDIGRQSARAFLDATKTVRAVSQSGRNARPSGRPHERRRTADAHGGAHADGQSAVGAAG
jgi:branched-chain amino acid transport system ATP-binding protein